MTVADEMIGKRARRRIENIRSHKAVSCVNAIQDDYAASHDGRQLDCGLIFFGVEASTRAYYLYGVLTVLLIIVCVALGIPFGIRSQIKVFVAIVLAFLAVCIMLVRHDQATSGFIVTSDAFIGVYYQNGKRAETTPSRLRRIEFSRHFLKVTCALEEEDFRLPYTDRGYLEFLMFMRGRNDDVTENIDYDKVETALREAAAMPDDA